jgi:hypothetical protein
MKKCRVCGLEKEMDEFNKHSASKDGHAHICQTCHRERAKKCRDEWLIDAKNKEWTRSKSNLKKRPYLVHRKEECRRCGFKPEHTCQLTVDHIDKDRSNNVEGNLQTLCHNCHNYKSWVETVSPEKLKIFNLIP